MPILLLVIAGVLGLAVGSFLNVVIHRVPIGASVVSPPSHCPACETPIRARHNVPVLGWLVLRGRCAECAARISARYPAVELATGVLFVVVAARVDHLGHRAAIPAYLYFAAIGVALSAIDLEVRRLPNAIVLPSYPVLGALLGGAALIEHDAGAAVRAGLAGLVLFAAFYALAFAYPAGMGFGDVKLAGLLGLVLGYLSWAAVLVGTFAGFFLGAVVGVAAILVGKAGRKSAIPFGPFLIAGALLALFVTDAVAGFYTVS